MEELKPLTNPIYAKVDEMFGTEELSYRSLISLLGHVKLWHEVDDTKGFSLVLLQDKKDPELYGVLSFRWEEDDWTELIESRSLGRVYKLLHDLAHKTKWSRDKEYLWGYLSGKYEFEFVDRYYNGERIFNKFKLRFLKELNLNPLSAYTDEELADELRSRIKEIDLRDQSWLV